MPTPHSSIKAAALIIALLLFTACGPQSAKRAGQGAAVGGVSGAAAGLVSALIWGGNVGEAAARGAAWGATSGAVSGAIVGSQEDKQAAQQQRARAEKELKKKLGDDGFAGLAALLWLEALTYIDQGDKAKAESMYPKLLEAQPEISSRNEVDSYAREGLQGLTNIRKKENLPVACSK